MAIYSNYYRCARDPFSLSPDPEFLFLSESHREGLAQMLYAIESRKGFAVLTGEVGCGKSTLLRSVLGSVDRSCRTAYIFNPPRSRRELYAMIGSELNIDLTNSENPIGRFNEYLLQVSRVSGTVALIIDEAQTLDPDLLETLRLLTNLETSTTKLIQVVLAGQPEFDVILDSAPQRALRQRVALRHRISRLSLSDTRHYIQLRLKLACGDTDLFSEKACAAVHNYSKGIPRLINLICDTAMLTGYAEDSPRITPIMIESAALDLRFKNSPVVVNDAATPYILRSCDACEEENTFAFIDSSARSRPPLFVTTIFVALFGLLLLISTHVSEAGKVVTRLLNYSVAFIDRVLGERPS